MPHAPPSFWTFTLTLLAVAVSAYFSTWLFQTIVGWFLRRKTGARREYILARAKQEDSQLQSAPRHSPNSDDGEWEKVEKNTVSSTSRGKDADDEWEGIIGFFHPFCNAGGGGERVLWAAIKATQQRWPRAVCVVYTGDHDTSKDDILEKVQVQKHTLS
ncbi:MAG: hypothetical protein L6R39_004531 [Caloplaca ligustica]|nr:MAG: hypothetical protein L6R39_004531 [Caloplaca ligustica]